MQGHFEKDNIQLHKKHGERTTAWTFFRASNTDTSFQAKLSELGRRTTA